MKCVSLLFQVFHARIFCMVRMQTNFMVSRMFVSCTYLFIVPMMHVSTFWVSDIHGHLQGSSSARISRFRVRRSGWPGGRLFGPVRVSEVRHFFFGQCAPQVAYSRPGVRVTCSFLTLVDLVDFFVVLVH